MSLLDELGALTATTVLILRRGTIAALAWLVGVSVLVLAPTVTAILALRLPEKWVTIVGLLAFLSLPLGYAGVLAAFTLALDGPPRARAVLRLVAARGRELVPIVFVGGFAGAIALATTCLTFVPLRELDAGGSGAYGPPLCAAFVFALLAFGALWLWGRIFVIPSAIVFGRRALNSERATEEAGAIARNRPLSFFMATLVPPGFLVAAIPDATSLGNVANFLDPATQLRVRWAVSVGALLLAVVSMAALSVAAYRTSAGELES